MVQNKLLFSALSLNPSTTHPGSLSVVSSLDSLDSISLVEKEMKRRTTKPRKLGDGKRKSGRLREM